MPTEETTQVVMEGSKHEDRSFNVLSIRKDCRIDRLRRTKKWIGNMPKGLSRDRLHADGWNVSMFSIDADERNIGCTLTCRKKKKNPWQHKDCTEHEDRMKPRRRHAEGLKNWSPSLHHNQRDVFTLPLILFGLLFLKNLRRRKSSIHCHCRWLIANWLRTPF